MSLTEQMERSAEIVRKAIEQYKPKAIVSLVSGGDDSLTAFKVAELLNIKAEIVHVVTGTGIRETHQFVEEWSDTTSASLMVGRAGNAYERYISRKGFFGKGERAHTMSYHVLKAQTLRKVISKIRQRRRNYPILMLTGIRLDESDNRKYNFANQTCKRDPGAKNNIFVNLIEHWSKPDCMELLSEVNAPRNPVAKALHRSAECMCGTMQSHEDREIASIIYPEWGQWIDALDVAISAKHGWGWGEDMPKSAKQERAGQLRLLSDDTFEMCRHCLAGAK